MTRVAEVTLRPPLQLRQVSVSQSVYKHIIQSVLTSPISSLSASRTLSRLALLSGTRVFQRCITKAKLGDAAPRAVAPA